MVIWPGHGERMVGAVRMVGALVAGLASVLFVLAPVTEHTTSYHWASSEHEPDAILPLSPYRPAGLTATLDCGRLVALAQGSSRVALSTVYAAYGSQAEHATRGASPRLTKPALRVTAGSGRVAIISGGATVARIGAEDLRSCSVVRVDVGRTQSKVWADDDLLQQRPGDLRPTMTGLFTDPAAGTVRVEVRADSQFDSSPTTIKIVFGVLAVLGLAMALFGVRRLDRDHARSLGVRAPPRRWPRGDIVDVGVLLIMASWMLIGAGTDDDGFIKQISDNRDAAGYFGNYVRWNNTPEAPFGWYYEVVHLWSQLTWEPVWMRLLPLILGLLGWVITRHLLLPRLIARPTWWVITATAGGFLPCWMLYANSLRPEIWFALGLALVLLLVDVGRTSRRALPICIAAVVAGVTSGVGPTGLVAFAPFLAALPSMIKIFGSRRSGVVATALTCLAGAGISLLLMFRDQTWASVLSSYRARVAFGPDYQWYDDARRYLAVLGSTFPRSLTVMVPVVIAGFVAVALLRYRSIAGVRTSLARLVITSYVLYFPILMFSPTKLYHHFGGLLLLTPLLCALAVQILSRRTGASPGLVAGMVFAAAAAVAFCLSRPNTWWEMANVGIWSSRQPIHLGGVNVSTPVLAGGVVLALVIIFIGYGWATRARISVRVRNLLLIGLAVWTAFPLVCFGAALLTRPGQYTIGAANAAALTGNGCLLERSLRVEPDPAAGLLTSPTTGTDFPRTGLGGLPVRSVGSGQHLTSGWYAIPTRESVAATPVVIRVKGVAPDDRIRLEFDHGPPLSVTARAPTPGGDVRLPLAKRPDANRLRLVVSRGGTADADLFVSAPRVPKTVTLRDLVGDDPVATDWRVGFFTPCLHQAQLGKGRVQMPVYLFGHEPVDQLVGSPYRGGPLGGLPDVARFVRLPLYPAGDDRAPMITSLQLFRVKPITETDQIRPEHGTKQRWGWESTPMSGR